MENKKLQSDRGSNFLVFGIPVESHLAILSYSLRLYQIYENHGFTNSMAGDFFFKTSEKWIWLWNPLGYQTLPKATSKYLTKDREWEGGKALSSFCTQRREEGLLPLLLQLTGTCKEKKKRSRRRKKRGGKHERVSSPFACLPRSSKPNSET